MPFLFLLLLTIACLPASWPEPSFWPGLTPQPWLCATLTWAGEGVLVLAAYGIAQLVRYRLRSFPERRDRLLRRYSSARFYHLLALIAFYGLALFVLGWGWTVQRLTAPPGTHRPDQMPDLYPGAELLILFPFVVGLLLSWTCFYDADQAVHETSPTASTRPPMASRWSYVLFRARQNLALLLAPLTLMIGEKGLQRSFDNNTSEWVVELSAMALIPLVFISFPWLLRLVLGVKPLPDGPLRDRLFATARRLRFRFSDVLLWNTHGTVANAMVAGLLPRPRYVLLTDRLVADLAPEEIEAVFGHEVGHIKHHHMFFYVGFLLISVLAVGQALAFAMLHLPRLRAMLSASDYWSELPVIGVLGAYIFVVFGFLSRRCERQADIYGCRAVSCASEPCTGHGDAIALAPGGRGLCPTGIRTFIDALDKVARLNGISRERQGWLQSWLHFTFAHRIQFLERMLADPGLEPRFQRTVRRVKWVLVLGMAAALVLLLSLEHWRGVQDFWAMLNGSPVPPLLPQ